MKENFLKLEELSTFQLDKLDRQKTIFFLTVSPLENHGNHLPLGMDLLEGQAICEKVAERFKNERNEWNVIVCPPITMGNGLMPGVGTVNIRQSVIRDFMIDYLSAFAKKGFKHAFVSGFHGGPTHLVAVDEAVHYINRKYETNIIAPFGYYISRIQRDKLKLPNKELQNLYDNHRGDIHGGLLETSFMLYLRPDLVHDYKSLENIDITIKNPLQKMKTLKKGLKEGYLGFPAKADKEIGKAFFDDAVELFYQSLIKCLEDKKYLKTIKTLDTSKPHLRTNFAKNLSSMFAIGLTGVGAYLFLKDKKDVLFKKS